jgi:hypothetical protein
MIFYQLRDFYQLDLCHSLRLDFILSAAKDLTSNGKRRERTF